MEPDDYIVPYYRDRGLVLGRGMTTRELGLEYFAKRNTGSGGRQMPSHYSNADLHIWSVPTPTGSQLLPACGIAWGIKLDGKKISLSPRSVTPRRARAIFSKRSVSRKKETCPCSSSSKTTPTASACRRGRPIRSRSDVLEPSDWQQIEGHDVQKVYDATAKRSRKSAPATGRAFSG